MNSRCTKIPKNLLQKSRGWSFGSPTASWRWAGWDLSCSPMFYSCIKRWTTGIVPRNTQQVRHRSCIFVSMCLYTFYQCQNNTIPYHAMAYDDGIALYDIKLHHDNFVTINSRTLHITKLSCHHSSPEGAFPEIDCLQCLQALCHFACSVSVCLGDLNFWGRDFKTIQPYCLHIPLLMAEIQLATWDVWNPIINGILLVLARFLNHQLYHVLVSDNCSWLFHVSNGEADHQQLV